MRKRNGAKKYKYNKEETTKRYKKKKKGSMEKLL